MNFSRLAFMRGRNSYSREYRCFIIDIKDLQIFHVIKELVVNNIALMKRIAPQSQYVDCALFPDIKLPRLTPLRGCSNMNPATATFSVTSLCGSPCFLTPSRKRCKTVSARLLHSQCRLFFCYNHQYIHEQQIST